jgi:hypothetical protein
MTETTPEGLPEPLASPPNVKKYALIAVPALLAISAYALLQNSGLSCSSADARETVGDIAREHQALVGAIRFQGDGSGVPVPVECGQDTECARLQEQFDAVRAEAINITSACNSIPQVIIYDNCPTISEDFQTFTAKDADGWGTTYYDEATSATPASQRKIYMANTAQPVIDQWKQAEASLNAATEALRDGNVKQANDAWDAAVMRVQYQLENVILTATDKDTGSVSCKADLVAEVPDWGQETLPITYTVEKTSEGNLYATVWGF